MMERYLELPNGDRIEAHRTDDPAVWGLLDVVLERRPLYPVTIYKTSGDSVSGVMGRLLPSGVFLMKAPTNIGRTFECKNVADESTWAETVWDGAAPAVTFVDADGNDRQEHTHGLLLGDYVEGSEKSTRQPGWRHFAGEFEERAA